MLIVETMEVFLIWDGFKSVDFVGLCFQGILCTLTGYM